MNTDRPVEPDLMARMEPVRLLAAYEAISPMPVRPEFIEGRAHVPQSPPDHRHSEAVMSLSLQFRSAAVPHAGTGNGYRFTDGTGTTTALLIPDLHVNHRKMTSADESHFATHPGWYPSDLLGLVGEVTSTNHETDTGPKFRTYAAAGIPVYVLINRRSKTAHCYTNPILPGDDPTEAYYANDTEVALGAPLALPAPYPTLDTAPFVTD
ncbi:Uma2 family endonuclease [Streptomyces roseochromogenus]|uniref:Uma2 family endonuclease n=1 Tax=Streptomyces roseochromogenus TaxID=285450 RepID=UPI001319F05C|nr:Uma2 family endonuclease [Streptomyces roseochromogenus]